MILGITLTFIVSRLILYGLIFVAPTGQFDTSTELTLKKLQALGTDDYWNVHLWNKLLSWDAVFFLKGMTSKGKIPRFEHELAFSTLWSSMVKYFAKTDDVYQTLKVAVLLENILFYSSSVVLYYLTRAIFSENNKKQYYGKRLAKISTNLFIFTSASGFLTGIYSEPLSFALTFVGILLHEKSTSTTIPNGIDCNWSRWPFYFLSAIFFAVATINRANCVLLGIYYIVDLLQLVSHRRMLKALFFPLLAGTTMLIVCLYQHYSLPYQAFCPQRGEWCTTQMFDGLPFTKTNFYGFIQSRYWNCGFLRYWTLNNIPNFLIAMPNFVVMFYSTIYFTRIYPSFRVRPLVFVTQAFLIMIALFAHVQIINRVSSFIPLHLWYLADRLLRNSFREQHPVGDDKIVKGYIYWLAFWIPIQTVLFACFLPPA
ncbi:hypothetical protein HG536_0G03040 [Torulaspora globosa]|uniref:GPI mannosyltransferase 2 n=1 Tax=Torulaspora globosa TaxID=48254 RepID=A0A7G3ZLQ6_9SACH|nr:uncharacterized protein HG536_0G03040 [Torulaspora globosa]QLL34442.1 hypothetical protein HG536_0G03040 [Torulaspora globosa]